MDRQERKRKRYQKALMYAEDLKRGLTLEEIGRKYGYTREYIRKILLLEIGVKSNKVHWKFYTKDIKDEAIKQLVNEFNEKIAKLKAEKDKAMHNFFIIRKQLEDLKNAR